MKANIKIFRFIFALLTAAIAAPAAAAGGGYALDSFPVEKLNDVPALQRGAKIFVNYCMGCHSANSMRYNRMHDIGLDEDQIENNLLFTNAKVGSTMQIPMRAADAKQWFGALPPDLSVTARARSSADGSGSDWMYTFLRSFYRDSDRATGWNNALFPNVGMPHVLWQLQGQRGATVTEVKAVEDKEGAAAADAKSAGGHGGSFEKTVATYDTMGLASRSHAPDTSVHPHARKTFAFADPVGGKLNSLDYDSAVADVVAFLTYVSDPSAKTRTRLGVWVLIFLGLLFWAAWMLNRAFWKDIK